MTVETTLQKPRLRELMTFIVAGPLISMLLLGLAVYRTAADLLFGFMIIFSRLLPFGYMFSLPAALCTGIAWQTIRMVCAEEEKPYRLPAFVIIIIIGAVGGLLPGMFFEGPADGGYVWRYMLHGSITAGLCGWLTQKLWIRTPAALPLVTATE